MYVSFNKMHLKQNKQNSQIELSKQTVNSALSCADDDDEEGGARGWNLCTQTFTSALTIAFRWIVKQKNN